VTVLSSLNLAQPADTTPHREEPWRTLVRRKRFDDMTPQHNAHAPDDGEAPEMSDPVDPVDERDTWLDDLGAAFTGSAEFATAIVEGEPGLGKSAMLDAAARTARREGHLVLQARCSELESTYDYALARRLIELVRLEASATFDRSAERPSVPPGTTATVKPGADRPLDADGTDPDIDTTSCVTDLYTEVSRVALWRPVVVAVDDLQWCDSPSAAALVYLARRATPGRILLIAAASPHSARHETGVADELMAEPTSRVLHLRPLSPGSVARLVQGQVPHASAPLVEACQSASGGNPFLLLSLLAELRRHAAPGHADDAAAVETLAPRVVARSIRRRLAAVPALWLRILQVAALLGDAADLASVADLAEADPEEVVPAIDAMVALCLFQRDDAFKFRYPLERSTVYAEMPPAVKAQAHAKTARVLSGRQAPVEEVARHLVLSEPAGDAWTIEQLEVCADQLLAAGDDELAVQCLRRVLREPLGERDRGRLLILAAAAESRVVAATAGLPYLRTAVELEADARALAVSALDLGRALPEGAERSELATLLPTIAGRLNDGDRGTEEFRLRLELTAAAEQLLPDAAGAPIVEALLNGRREGADRLERQALAQLASIRSLDGRRWNADAVAELAQQLVDTDELTPTDPTDVRHWIRALATIARAGRFEHAAAQAERARRLTAASADEAAFLELTSVLAYVHLLQGSLEAAEKECRRITGPGANATGASVESEPLQRARAVLAVILEERGRADEAIQVLEQRPIPRSFPGLGMLELRGRLRLESGDTESALTDLREAADQAQQLGIDNPAVYTGRAALALALHRTGASDEAWRLAQEEVAVARAFGAAWSLGAALRTAATVAPTVKRLQLITEAVEVLEDSGAGLELAHALVDRGQLLVATGDKKTAREVLRRGADAAFRCSATPLVNRAVELLRAAGARPRRVALSGAGALTPMERRAAELAVAGHANAEIAEMLFVNSKTVEAHLSRVYRKLHIRSRRELPSSLDRARADESTLQRTGSDGGTAH
jgi:DNA-binding CsgD family transcriptional regulator